MHSPAALDYEKTASPAENEGLSESFVWKSSLTRPERVFFLQGELFSADVETSHRRLCETSTRFIWVGCDANRRNNDDLQKQLRNAASASCEVPTMGMLISNSALNITNVRDPAMKGKHLKFFAGNATLRRNP